MNIIRLYRSILFDGVSILGKLSNQEKISIESVTYMQSECKKRFSHSFISKNRQKRRKQNNRDLAKDFNPPHTMFWTKFIEFFFS